jgi:trk system potassium uptake protein
MRKIGVGIGLMLHVPGVMALLSIPIALFFNETFAVKAFAWTGAGCLLLAQGLFHLTKNRSEEFSLTEMMWIASLGWLLASSFAALPFYLIAISLPAPQLATYQMEPFTEWINAHFESLSGITSTGLTVSISESNLPFSMQWWRTFLQWVGAIGIIVFVSTFYKSFRTVSDHYSQGEEKEEILPDVEVRWYKIWWIYLLLTAFSITLLLVQKVPWWEAVNHGMTAIATGGFTVLDDSVELYDSRLKLSLIFIMVLGALNFNLYHLLFLKGKWKRFLGDQQHIFFVCFMIAGSVFLLLENNIWGDRADHWLDLAFQFTSAISTTGFMSVSLDGWPNTSLLMLSLAMLIGGATASTAGGIKILRFLLLIKGNFHSTLQWVYSYEKNLKFYWNEHELTHEESLELYRNVGTFHFFYLFFFVLMTYLMLLGVPGDIRLSEIIFEVASAYGTTGLSIGLTDHSLNFSSKIVLMATMYVGRLELIPFVVIFATILKAQLEKEEEAV